MHKKRLKRLLPQKHELVQGGTLRLFASWLSHASIWHINRRSISRAVLVGMFCAFIPIPIQMFIAAFICILIRANLPASLLCVWITNPLTIAPIFYSTYKLGAFILDIPPQSFDFEMTWEWMTTGFSIVWKPLFLGSFIAGCFFSALAYTIVDIAWRWRTVKKWRNRHSKNKHHS